MNDLFHIHLMGIKDYKWKEKQEIIIDDSFENRLAKRCNNFNDAIPTEFLNNICTEINFMLNNNGYQTFDNMPMYMIIDHIQSFKGGNIDKETFIKLLTNLRNITFNAAMMKRELAMEQYRKDNHNDLPSRLHCIYATDYEGLNYWRRQITDGDITIYRIEAIDEPFKTSEIFIPSEDYNFEGMYNHSYHYWNPNFKNIPTDQTEYLVNGKVKILEKVMEFKKL